MILLFEIPAMLTDLTFLTRAVIITLFAGFMPLMTISYFRLMMGKKQRKYDKAMHEMGITSNRKIKDTYSPAKYFLPVTFVTIICFLGIGNIIFADRVVAGINDSLLLTGADFGRANKPLINQSFGVVSWAFIGSFIWSAQNVLRRMINVDLVPSVFYTAGVRILLAVAVALVVSFLIGEHGATAYVNFNSSLPGIAFLTGMFPERMLTYLNKTYEKYISREDIKMNYDTLSLDNVQGMSLAHKERLAEMSIDNAQNLATASLTQMLIETPYEARQLLDWIGQAKLLCYAQNDIQKVRSAGIRTVYDLQKGEKSNNLLQRISDQVGIHSPLLHVLKEQIEDDEGIKALYAFQQRINAPMRDIPIGNKTTAVG